MSHAVLSRPATGDLPQLGGKLFLTDGGLETTLLFHDGIDLACFAAIDMLRKPGGRAHLERYFETYIAVAKECGAGFVLESATWRSSRDWAQPLGLSLDELAALNREAIEMLHQLRARHQTDECPIVVSGCIGPRGDGYDPGEVMTVKEAHAYHAWQADLFAEAGADMIAGITITNVPEAIGIVLAARDAGLPCAISFTVETDGRLPTGDTLPEAIAAVDRATGGGPAYYMINCAHPSHFAPALMAGGDWIARVRGLRGNASKLSHAELDGMEELDTGDPEAFGRENAELRAALPHLSVLGGCCGTDHRHIAGIAHALGH
jgi:S-methylmethionine-dependent homocysteine/selenocysteine methylase